MPCCFGAFCQQQQQQQQQQRQQPSRISHKFPQVFSSSKGSTSHVSTFSVRFWGLFVLPCLAVSSVLVGFQKSLYVTLGTFSVRFCCLFVLPCLAVLVPGDALATLLSAAAAAAQRQQPSRISHKFPQAFSSSKGSRSHVRHFFGAILRPVRPSVPCCFGAGRCFWYSSVSSSSSSSNGSSRLVSLISSLRSSSSSRVSSRLVSLISSLKSSVLVGFQKSR